MTTAERPLRADARRNRDRLVEVARSAFAERGLDAPLDDIARRAGVGPGTLYRHFPTREALLAAVYRGDIENLAARARELAASCPPREALARWMSDQLDYTFATKLGMGSAIKAMLRDDSETMDYCRNTLRGALGELIDAATADGSIRPGVQAITLLRLVHGIAVACETEPEQAPAMLSIVVDGITAV